MSGPGASKWRLNRLGRRFMWASLGVLAVAVAMIVFAARQMFISDQDLDFLLWILVPATVAAAVVAYVLSAPIARDAHRLSDAAARIGAGDLAARTGVRRSDELGDAAREFDRMAARLEAVEQERALMLSSISHDLRTPLAALRASVEAIRDGVVDDPDTYLKGMERQVEALGELVGDLQLHTRIASGTLEIRRTRIDLTELADEAIETVRPLARRSEVALDLRADGRVMVDGDPGQLARVLRNLLENAIRHTPAATTVTVTVGVEDAGVRRHAGDSGGDDSVDGAGTDAGERFAVTRVCDDGPGFPSDLGDRVFDAFTRGDPARDVRTGTAGLGLAIARGIVEMHGGTVAIGDSESDNGGVVEIRLPVVFPARGVVSRARLHLE